MRLPGAILSGVAVAVASALPLARFGHGLNGGHGSVAWVALILGIIAAFFAWRIIPEVKEFRPISIWEWMMIAIFACASARAFFWLIYTDGDELKVLSPNNLGDLSLHLAFIHWLAATRHWWPASPILVGDPLRYPPGSDLFNSLLLVAGVPVIQGLLWCGLAGAALTGIALWRWGRGIALAALLFNGGFAGYALLQGKDPDAVSEWKNLFLTLFVTQRGFLFALPAGLLLLSAWREENFETRDHGKARTILPLPVQALLLGVMPLFSVHTALFLGVTMVVVALFHPQGRSRFIRLASFAWPPMAFFGWLVTSGAGGHSAVHALGWQPGWMSDGAAGFWFWNFGISLPLAGMLCLVLLPWEKLLNPRSSVVIFVNEIFPKANSPEARAFVWPAALIFASCLLIRFAPWPWDNTKLMLWSWVVIIPYLWSILMQNRSVESRVIVFLLLFGSGAATLEAGLDGRHGYEIIKRSTLDATASMLRHVPREAVIACAPEYNQAVLMLGHPVVCGYEGNLWSHGLDYKDRLAALNSIMMGDPGWRQRAHAIHASWMLWSEPEAARWPASRLPWAHETAPSLHRLY